MERLQIDSFLCRVLDCLHNEPGVTEIELSTDGCWRPAGGGYGWCPPTHADRPPLRSVSSVMDDVSLESIYGLRGPSIDMLPAYDTDRLNSVLGPLPDL